MPLGATKVGLLGAAGSGGGAFVAFGGLISQYTDSGTTYRVHTFRGSGKFFVSVGSADVDWLIVAGGETAGAVVGALGIKGLRIGPEIDPGVPWTMSLGEPALALALKSGNFGGPDFFTAAFKKLS